MLPIFAGPAAPDAGAVTQVMKKNQNPSIAVYKRAHRTLKYHFARSPMRHKITSIPGDGIGPEVSRAVREIIAAAGVEVEWEDTEAKGDIHEHGAASIRHAVIDSIRKNRVALKGPLATAVASGPPSINVALRKALDLFANVRPVKNLEGAPSRYRNVDLVLIRENTEDLYAGLEHTVVPGVVESLKIITEKASSRIARYAFEYARKHGRKKIHAIHKANIMKLSDGLFLSSVRAIAAEYPDIQYKELIVDNACMQMVLNPSQFDMLLLTNLYGDIMSDLAAGLVGGLGVVPSGNIGADSAIFEAVHGTAPDIAGKGVANPTALLMSAIMMLEHIGETSAAQRIDAALHEVYREGRSLTRDVGGAATTAQFTEAVINKLGVFVRA
jgi:isocitrate dehydrogenase (NAD+)